MIKEVIILAGGLGTRLRSVVADKPKCMAPVAGKPFLHYLIDFLQKQDIENFIFSVGYMHEVIEEYLQQSYPHLSYTLSLEKEPLGNYLNYSNVVFFIRTNLKRIRPFLKMKQKD